MGDEHFLNSGTLMKWSEWELLGAELFGKSDLPSARYYDYILIVLDNSKQYFPSVLIAQVISI